MELIQEYVGVFRCQGSARSIPMALGYLTEMAISLGDFATAAQAAQEKADIELSRNQAVDRAYGLYSLGTVNFAQGHVVPARRQLESALKIARQAADHGLTSDILFGLARMALYEGSPDQAAELYEESRRLGKEGVWRPWVEAHVLLGLGQVACARRDFGLALRLLRESLHQIQVVRQQIPIRLEVLAQACLGLGRAEQAATLLGAAHSLRAAMGAPVPLIEEPNFTATLKGAGSALGDDAFRRAWAAGKAMPVEHAVAHALAIGDA